ncbi:MAG: hypothetical protein IJY46_07595 [Lentisphaeria bacterium]|nr:hypothetical protein [Lentisphaeria bacterium]
MAPEEAAGDRRRLAMAAYYFGFQPGMFDYAYDNFEQFSNKANGGKQLDAWADFDRVAQSFGVQQAKPEESQPGFFSGGWMVVLFLILILIIFTLKTVLKYVKTCATSMCKFLQNIFSKENYFKTCILIFYFVIAISMISIAFKICL